MAGFENNVVLGEHEESSANFCHASGEISCKKVFSKELVLMPISQTTWTTGGLRKQPGNWNEVEQLMASASGGIWIRRAVRNRFFFHPTRNETGEYSAGFSPLSTSGRWSRLSSVVRVDTDELFGAIMLIRVRGDRTMLSY